MQQPTYMHSLSHLATLAERPVAEVQRIIDQIGARPALVLNLTQYFDAEMCGTVIARAKGWADQPAYHKTYFDTVQSDA